MGVALVYFSSLRHASIIHSSGSGFWNIVFTLLIQTVTRSLPEVLYLTVSANLNFGVTESSPFSTG